MLNIPKFYDEAHIISDNFDFFIIGFGNFWKFRHFTIYTYFMEMDFLAERLQRIAQRVEKTFGNYFSFFEMQKILFHLKLFLIK